MVKYASKIKALRLFELTAVTIVDSFRVLGSVQGSEKAYDANNKNIPSKPLCMPHKKLATKIKFLSSGQHRTHGISSQTWKPTSKPTSYLRSSTLRCLMIKIFLSCPGANRIRNGVRRVSDRMRSS